jgi:Domain of unknown function (DUF4375)
VFRSITRGERGESVQFDMGDLDQRWKRVADVLGSLQERDGLPKEHRVQDLSMTVPSWDELVQQTKERVAAHIKSQPGPKWLDGHSGETTEQLLSLEGKYRTDSLVLAFEQAIGQKAKREGRQSLTDQERIVLAVEALEREVNNGGYDQFFLNSSREFAPVIVGALERIGCKKTANVTRRAIKALGISDLTSDAIEAVISTPDEGRRSKLNRCDDSYYKSAEPIADRLFAFIKANKASIRF